FFGDGQRSRTSCNSLNHACSFFVKVAISLSFDANACCNAVYDMNAGFDEKILFPSSVESTAG
ncbi:hypothetical protein ACSLOP_30085, partial [Escherichia coli]